MLKAAVPNPTNAYTYYTGLIREVQRVLKGDPLDLDNYPGQAAVGVKLKVRAPTLQNISFNLIIVSGFGVVESTLSAAIRDAVQGYVNALGIGDDAAILAPPPDRHLVVAMDTLRRSGYDHIVLDTPSVIGSGWPGSGTPAAAADSACAARRTSARILATPAGTPMGDTPTSPPCQRISRTGCRPTWW